jgi:hypothetical protein
MRWLLLGLTVLLTSCAGMSKVGPGEVTIKDQMVAKLDSAWNRLEARNAEKTEIWTTDGLTLDSLMFYVGVKDGDPLMELQNRQEKQQPRFHATMQPHEIVELFDAVATENGNRFKLDKLSPMPFAGGNGFRFDFTQIRKGDEIELKGVGYGSLRAGKLYLMVFRAPKVYYFGKHIGRVEAVARSVQVRG